MGEAGRSSPGLCGTERSPNRLRGLCGRSGGKPWSSQQEFGRPPRHPKSLLLVLFFLSFFLPPFPSLVLPPSRFELALGALLTMNNKLFETLLEITFMGGNRLCMGCMTVPGCHPGSELLLEGLQLRRKWISKLQREKNIKQPKPPKKPQNCCF